MYVERSKSLHGDKLEFTSHRLVASYVSIIYVYRNIILTVLFYSLSGSQFIHVVYIFVMVRSRSPDYNAVLSLTVSYIIYIINCSVSDKFLL